jgi:hypothetical protein
VNGPTTSDKYPLPAGKETLLLIDAKAGAGRTLERPVFNRTTRRGVKKCKDEEDKLPDVEASQRNRKCTQIAHSSKCQLNFDNILQIYPLLSISSAPLFLPISTLNLQIHSLVSGHMIFQNIKQISSLPGLNLLTRAYNA